jgi:hypothetical protein
MGRHLKIFHTLGVSGLHFLVSVPCARSLEWNTGGGAIFVVARFLLDLLKWWVHVQCIGAS